MKKNQHIQELRERPAGWLDRSLDIRFSGAERDRRSNLSSSLRRHLNEDTPPARQEEKWWLCPACLAWHNWRDATHDEAVRNQGSD